MVTLPTVDHRHNWLQQFQLTLLEATKDYFQPAKAFSKKKMPVSRWLQVVFCTAFGSPAVTPGDLSPALLNCRLGLHSSDFLG